MEVSYEYLREMIGSKETLFVEWKSDDNNTFNDSVLVNSCVALANAEGGQLFIGIRDCTGEIIGSKKAQLNNANERALEGLIRSRTMPNLNVDVMFLNLPDGKIIVRVVVPKAITVIGTTDGRYLKREILPSGEPGNKPMTPDEIFRNTTSIGFVDLSANIMSGLHMDDIDIELVENSIRDVLKKDLKEEEIAIFSQEPINVLKTLGLVNSDNIPNIAAVLLFGKEGSLKEKFPNHFVQYQVFGSQGEVLKNEKYSLPIIKLLPKLLVMPELLKNTDEFLVNAQSLVVPEYAPDALREAFANAIVHRDYSLYSGIQIQVFNDELNITSAGGFVKGVSLQNLLRTPPIPRNRRLADAMKALKLVETSGRGIDKIYYFQAKYGRPAPDYSASTENHVIVNICGGKANLDFCKFVFSISDEIHLFDMLILNYLFYQRSATMAQLASLVQSSEMEVRRITRRLLEKNLIEVVDEGNPLFFLKGMAPKNKIRLRDSNISEYENSIQNLLKEHDKLSRNDIAKYIGLSPAQTYRVLLKMQASGKVVMTGYRWKAQQIFL